MDNKLYQRYTSPDSVLSILKTVSFPSAPPSYPPLFPPFASGGGGSACTPCRSQFSGSRTDASCNVRFACVLCTLTLDRLLHVLRWSETLSPSTVWMFWPSGRLDCRIRSTLDPSTLITTCSFAWTDPSRRGSSVTLYIDESVCPILPDQLGRPAGGYSQLLLCLSILLAVGWRSSTAIVANHGCEHLFIKIIFCADHKLK